MLTHLQLTMKNKTMPILDLQIIREDEIIITTVYVKPIFSGVYTHFDSFYHLPSVYAQIGVNYTQNYFFKTKFLKK